VKPVYISWSANRTGLLETERAIARIDRRGDRLLVMSC
jgi:hypothetical protein